MYAVVAPGFKGIYRDSKSLNDVLALFPYARFRKFFTEEQCMQWLAENVSTRKLEAVSDYGDALPMCHVVMSYYLRDRRLCLNYDTSNFGTMRISVDDSIVKDLDQSKSMCCCEVEFSFTGNYIQRQLLAIRQGLLILGDMVDVVVKVPDHSVFYALRSYTGKDVIVRRVQEFVRERQGGISISLK